MTTQMWLVDSLSDIDPTSDNEELLDFIRGTSGSGIGTNTNTVTGPTAGVQLATASPVRWFSPQLAAVTISGTVTMNLWMSENNMSANVGADILIERCDSAGSVISTILRSERGVEVVVGPPTTANNWTATPTSTTLADGDRIRVTVFGNDVGTMATGFMFRLTWSCATAAAEGDTWIQFTETIAEMAAVPYVDQVAEMSDQMTGLMF